MLNEKDIQIIENIFLKNFQQIKIYLFFNEYDLNNMTELEYKENLKKEYFLHKNNNVEKIFEIKEKELKEKNNKDLSGAGIGWYVDQILKKKKIFEMIQENLIDLFVDECYKRNVLYIEAQKKQPSIISYKKEWQNKNVLWKVLHQKYNPKKINFESMEKTTIDELKDDIKQR